MKSKLTRRQFNTGLLAVPALTAPALIGTASAQVTAVRLGKQYGLPFLPQMVMESQKLIEKQAAARGLPSLEADWTTLSGPGALNDALLSGSIEFVNVAAPSLVTLWARSANTPRPVRGLCAVQSMPYVLVTRNPTVKTIADLTEQDKIAVPTVKISGQAMALQMAAAKLWGMDQWRASMLGRSRWAIPMPSPRCSRANHTSPRISASRRSTTTNSQSPRCARS